MIRFGLVCVLMALAVSSSASRKSDFLISYWVGPTAANQKAFAQIAQSNFNVVMFGGNSVEENKKALDVAQANGLKAMIFDARGMSTSAADKKFQSNLDSLIADYGSHLAFWGYVLDDEPHAARFIRLGYVNKYLLRKDRKHVPFINLFPTYASKEQLGHSDYEHHVDEFCRVVRPRMLSYDHYALMEKGERPDYFRNLEIIRRQGIKHKVPFSLTVLSVKHFSYRDPSESDLRWQVNTALAYGARGIMYFTYSSPGWDSYQDALINRDGGLNRKYHEVARINGEIMKLAPTLMKLNSVAVYHTGAVPDGSKALPSGGLIADIKGGQFVIGQFVSKDGGRYAMLVNRSFSETADASIRFSKKVALYEVSPETGRQRRLPLTDTDSGSTWHTTFAPGTARLVRIDVLEDGPIEHWEDLPHFRPRIVLDPSAQYQNVIYAEKKDDPYLYVEGLNMYDIAVRVRDELLADGRVDVFINRDARDEPVTLEQETERARALNCDVLVSLHSDATGKKDDPGGGSWTFYADDVEGKRLAECVQTPLLEAIKTFHPDVLFRGVRTHWYRLWVLHESGCPASLTEVLFHSNPEEREMLKNPECQAVMAKAIARGILNYFGLSSQGE